MLALSDNHFSHDQQLDDAMRYVQQNHPEQYATLLAEFPEWEHRTFQRYGSWLDTDAMGVDDEWSSWLTDALENTGLIIWEDGEPYAYVGTEAGECE